jgi:AcrR family transcriptional regulator
LVYKNLQYDLTPACMRTGTGKALLLKQIEVSFKRRTREATEVRRARIIEEAIGLFGERGYYGFTIGELGKRCGLSNPGLLHYFPSKLDVLLQVLAELETRESEFMEPLFQQAVHESGSKAAVRTMLRAMGIRIAAHPENLRVLVELQAESLSPEHPAHEWWVRRDAITRQFIADILRPYVPRPESVARQVLALMDGFCTLWLRDNPLRDIASEWDDAVARLLPELGDDHA